MTLLELVQQVCAELGLNQPSSVVSSTNNQTIQMFALIKRLGHDLMRQFDWQKLDTEGLIITQSTTLSGTTVQGSYQVTVADTSGLSTNWGVNGVGITPFSTIESIDSGTQVTLNMPATSSGTNDLTFAQVNYPLPADWGGQIPQTEWDRTNRWPLIGPKSSQEWQSFKSGFVRRPKASIRIIDGSVHLNPPPSINGGILAYEYISSYWAISATGTPKYTFTADDDTCVFDDSLMILGTQTLWLRAKGLDNSG